jgi:hemerythrin
MGEASVGFITWNRVCIVGVRAMDQQHAVLMDTLNDLRVAVTQGAAHDRISKELRRLLDFTAMHFASEERLLVQQGFPAAVEHRQAHERMMDQMHHVAQRAGHLGNTELQPLIGFLRAWFVDHIEQLDVTYGEWLNERGVF